MKKYYQPELVKKSVPLESIPEEVRAQFLRPGQLLAIQESFPVAFQPLGTLEWHGRQNPIGCDAIKAENVCVGAAKKAGGAVMPAMYFSSDAYRSCGTGVGLGMDAVAGFQLPGSFYEIDTDLLKRFLLNACRNYLSRGFKLVIIVSGHNPNIQRNLLDEVCYLMKTPEGKEPVQALMEFDAADPGKMRMKPDHAAGYETSMMLHLAGERVNMRANDGQEIPDLAILGSTPYHEASREEGELYFDMEVDSLAEFAIKKLKEV